MAGTAWRPSLVRLALCAGFLCAAWMLLGAGQARADELSGPHHAERSSVAKAPSSAPAGHRRESAHTARIRPELREERVVPKVAHAVVRTATIAPKLVDAAPSPATAVRSVMKAVGGLRPGAGSLVGVVTEVRQVVARQRPVAVPSVPTLPLLGSSVRRAPVRVKPVGAPHQQVGSVHAAVPAAGPVATDTARTVDSAGSVVNGLSAVAPSSPPLPRGPVAPWPIPAPTSPQLQRGPGTGSGATDCVMLGGSSPDALPQSTRYAAALALPDSSALVGPDHRPD